MLKLATKKELKYATGADTSNLDFIDLKDKVGKLDADKLIHVSSGCSNLKTKVNDLDSDKIRAVTVDLKNVSDLVD